MYGSFVTLGDLTYFVKKYSCSDLSTMQNSEYDIDMRYKLHTLCQQ